MSSLSLRLPDSLHEQVRALAVRDAISINQFIATAVAEKTAALLAVEYIAERAKRGDRSAFDRILARVPRVPPLPGEEVGPAKERRAGRAHQQWQAGKARGKAAKTPKKLRSRFPG
ncbi:MAG TPA: toxin-antitoxin system HicB family antitoxin [Candidatus Methylomirabilis sp.]|nr:toxin-antitoxin system HicB family antitoxin [Candidatus Methylomirabilis sp.]